MDTSLCALTHRVVGSKPNRPEKPRISGSVPDIQKFRFISSVRFRISEELPGTDNLTHTFKSTSFIFVNKETLFY